MSFTQNDKRRFHPVPHSEGHAVQIFMNEYKPSVTSSLSLSLSLIRDNVPVPPIYTVSRLEGGTHDGPKPTLERSPAAPVLPLHFGGEARSMPGHENRPRHQRRDQYRNRSPSVRWAGDRTDVPHLVPHDLAGGTVVVVALGLAALGLASLGLASLGLATLRVRLVGLGIVLPPLGGEYGAAAIGPGAVLRIRIRRDDRRTRRRRGLGGGRSPSPHVVGELIH